MSSVQGAKGTASGLEGIVVAETRLSHVDGELGELILKGSMAEELAQSASYEQACSLFWGVEEQRVRKELALGRRKAHERIPRLGNALETADAMDGLRTAVSHMEGATEAELASAIAVFGAAWSRLAQGLAPVPPEQDAGMAEDYLRMATGGRPSHAEARALDAYLVTVSDHGMNASTFTARVVASTGSDLTSAIVAAIGALKGPLHGGAPGPVLDMLDEIGAPAKARGWLQAELAAGRRIMGMGHRIYRVRDPRAAVFEQAIERLEKEGVQVERLALARAVEREAEALLREAKPERPLRANVEFYTAVLLEALGLPRQLFSPAFALGRVIGWCAHIAEQKEHGRLIRPNSLYVGPRPRETSQ